MAPTWSKLNMCDCLYGAAGGNQGGYLTCLSLPAGEQLWMEREAPKGSLTLADGRLTCAPREAPCS